MCTPCAQGSAALGRNVSEWGKDHSKEHTVTPCPEDTTRCRGKKGFVAFSFSFGFQFLKLTPILEPESSLVKVDKLNCVSVRRVLSQRDYPDYLVLNIFCGDFQNVFHSPFKYP